MKKLLFVVVVVLATTTSFAQTSKSTWLLGGNAGFISESSSGGGGSSTTWNLSPSLGYFVGDNLAIGANVGLLGLEGSTLTNFGPFVRYYFVDLGTSAKLFGNANVSFESGGGQSSTAIGAGAGIAAFLNKSIAFEAGLGYSNNTTFKTSAIGLRVGFQIHFSK